MEVEVSMIYEERYISLSDFCPTNSRKVTHPRSIEDFHRKLYRIRGEVHQLDVLDTSGNHPFPAMRRLSFLTGKFVRLHSAETIVV